MAHGILAQSHMGLLARLRSWQCLTPDFQCPLASVEQFLIPVYHVVVFTVKTDKHCFLCLVGGPDSFEGTQDLEPAERWEEGMYQLNMRSPRREGFPSWTHFELCSLFNRS